MSTNKHNQGNPHDNSERPVSHAAFWDVAAGMGELVTTLETKYQEGDELDAILVHNIIEAMAAFLALYAVSRFHPADVKTLGRALNRRLADCLTEVVGPTPVPLTLIEGLYPTGWPDAA
jgi:hypothetical protein